MYLFIYILPKKFKNPLALYTRRREEEIKGRYANESGTHSDRWEGLWETFLL